MDRESRIFEILEKLGVNTTRLRWKLYKWEKRRENKQSGIQLPASLHWLRYPNKHCLHCGKLVDGDAKVCPQCERRVPSLLMYRIIRLLGLAAPGAAPPTIIIFLVVMVAVFLLEIVMQGASAVISPSRETMLIFGAWTPVLTVGYEQYWRYLAFGLSHMGILHIGFNCFALMQVGPIVEVQTGKARMLVLITVTQITSALATQFWFLNVHHEVQALTLGASGWLFGLIGFGIAYFWTVGGQARMYRDVLVQWAIYALMFGFFIGANNAAHIGGLVGGLILGVLPLGDTHRTRSIGYVWMAAAYASAVLWCITLVYMGMFVVANWTPGGGAG